jgi:hypothetical protein
VKRPFPAGTAPGAGPAPINQPLLQRVAGVVRHPRNTFRAVVSNPTWGTLLLLTTVVSLAAGVALMQTEVGRQALVDQWERTTAAFGRPVDDAGYAELQELSERGAAAYAAASAIASGPVLAIAMAVLLALVARGTTFTQRMAVVTHAGVILALRQLVAAPISYVRESTASATSLASWFPMLDEVSPVARFLGALDVFVIWWVIVLAIGVAVLTGRRTRIVAGALVGVYAGLALLLAAVMAIAGRSA